MTIKKTKKILIKCVYITWCGANHQEWEFYVNMQEDTDRETAFSSPSFLLLLLILLSSSSSSSYPPFFFFFLLKVFLAQFKCINYFTKKTENTSSEHFHQPVLM